ncbi:MULTISPECIES: type II secretion system F family protein [unclassified Psychrobacter]|uniref:type II secretion system F family protein n=1 Tax=unclassified Psychrobacter TaxID=196806 RepID=UPI0018681804|nr:MULTISPECIES: type II secretion system F family protein [unclassified Psychrobacter]
MFVGIFVILTIIFFIVYTFFFKNVSNFYDTKRLDSFKKVFDQNFSESNIDRYFLIYIVVSILLMFSALYFLSNYILVFGIVAALVALPFILIRYIKQKRINLFEKQLPDAIDLMGGSLLAGNSLSGAFSLIAEEYPPPLSQEIGLLVREQKLGVSVDHSLQNFTKRMPLNSVVLTVAVIRTSIETGGELSYALKNVAQTLRSIAQAEGKIKALTSQGKMQAWVVGSMPIALIMILSKMEPEAMSQLWTTTEGYMALGALIVFEILGIIFIRKIVNIDI